MNQGKQNTLQMYRGYIQMVSMRVRDVDGWLITGTESLLENWGNLEGELLGQGILDSENIHSSLTMFGVEVAIYTYNTAQSHSWNKGKAVARNREDLEKVLIAHHQYRPTIPGEYSNLSLIHI